MTLFKKLLLYTIFFTLFLPQYGLSRGPANQIILNPYLNPFPRNGETLGGASVALADSVPTIFKNPANVSQHSRFKAFISLNYGRNYNESTTSDFTTVYKQENDDFYINSFALSVPFKVLNVPISLAASYNSNHAYEYESGNYEISDRFSSQSHLASIGLGLKPSPKLRFGLGWTRLIQKHQQISVNIPTDECSSNEANYTSDIFYAGLQNDPNETLSFGLVFYFPSKLKADQESTIHWVGGQEYSASLKLGAGFHLAEKWTLGLGYGYQWLNSYESGLSTLSAGVGYTFLWDNASLPIYMMYETILFPDKLNENISDQGERVLKYHQVGLGAGIQFTDFSIYAASTWSIYGDYYYTSPLISPLPPFS